MSISAASLLAHPLVLVGTTIGAFQLGTLLYERSGRLAILQPVLIAILAMIAFLVVTGTTYAAYLEGTAMLHLLIAPAIVALAVPLHDDLRKARAALPSLFATLAIGGAAVVLSALAIGLAFGLDQAMLVSLTTKSVSAPIALGVAERIGGDPGLTVLSVFVTGILGVIVAPVLLRLLRVEDEAVYGFTLGVCAHAFGIARALEISPQAAAFATLGMGLMGCAVAFLVPLAFVLLG